MEPRVKITFSLGCSAVREYITARLSRDSFFCVRFASLTDRFQHLKKNQRHLQTQHRLRWDPEAAQLGHRAEEGGDRHWAQEHTSADGFPGPHQPGHRQNRVPAGCLQPNRVL